MNPSDIELKSEPLRPDDASLFPWFGLPVVKPELLRPMGLRGSWAFGPLAFLDAGCLTPQGPRLCMLSFARDDWPSDSETLLQVLASVVRWARRKHKPLPARVFSPMPLNPQDRSDLRSRRWRRPADTWEERSTWLLHQTQSRTHVVMVHEPSGRVELQPCPSVKPGVPAGGMDAAQTWLPVPWFNLCIGEVLKALSEYRPNRAQLNLDLDLH